MCGWVEGLLPNLWEMVVSLFNERLLGVLLAEVLSQSTVHGRDSFKPNELF
jgi:hypothetical protein